MALEERDVVKRLRLALDLVSQERELSKLQQEISQQVETKLSSQQRTFLLNEQLKTVKKELGVETDDKDALVKKFRNRIASIEGVVPFDFRTGRHPARALTHPQRLARGTRPHPRSPPRRPCARRAR